MELLPQLEWKSLPFQPFQDVTKRIRLNVVTFLPSCFTRNDLHVLCKTSFRNVIQFVIISQTIALFLKTTFQKHVDFFSPRGVGQVDQVRILWNII